MNVTKSGGGNWKSYGATVGAVSSCVNAPDPGVGTWSVSFNTTVPAATGTYSISFGTFTNVNCGGAGGSLTWASAIVVKTNQTITFGAQGAQTYSPSGTFAISPVATASSGLAVTYSSLTTGVCTIAGTTVTIVTAGTCTIAADQAGNVNYYAAPQVTQNITINKANQAALTVTAPASVTYGSTGALTSSGGSGTGALTYSAGASTGCNITGGTTLNVSDASGTCSVTVTKAADTNYLVATSAAFPVTLNKASQAALTVTGPASVTYGSTGILTSSGGSGTGAVTFSAGASTGCSVTPPTTLNVTNASGTCSVTATKAADNNYNISATSASFPVTLNKASQAALTVTGPASVTYGSTGALTSSGGSGTGAVTFSAGASTGCSVTPPTTLNVTNASGSCSVTVTKAADTNYLVATSAAFPVTLNKASQAALTVTAPASVTYGSTGTLTSSGGSGTGALTYSTGASTGCNITGGTTLNVSDASGTCSVTVTKAADTNYLVATSAAFPVTLNKANQAALTVTAPASVTYGSTGTLTSSGGSGTGAVSFSVGASTGCSVTPPTTLNVTNASGTCNATATKAADNNYLVATSAAFPVTLNKANQTIGIISFAPGTLTVGSTTTASATATSGLTVTFTSTTPAVCTATGANGATITGVTTGTCTIAADQAGDGNYNAAPQVTQSIAVASAVASFNGCSDSDACPPSSARLYTRIANRAFALYLAALKSDGTVTTTFSGNATVSLLGRIASGGAIGGDNCPSGAVDLTQSLGTLAFASGKRTQTGVTVANAYRDLRVKFVCDATNCPPSGIAVCSGDNFAVRPDNMVISATITSPLKAGNVANGDTFTLSALASGNDTTTNTYDGTPQIDASKVAAVNSGPNITGTLDGIFGAGAGGTASGTFGYSEVGYFSIGIDGVHDSGASRFTTVDSSPGDCTDDFNNSYTAADPTSKVGCKFGNQSVSGNIGRFHPSHFETVVTGPMRCTGLSFAPACPSGPSGENLAYSGQAFITTVTAYRVGGSGASGVTQNYAGTSAYDVTLTAWDAIGSVALQNPPASGGALSVDPTTIAATDFALGQATTATPAYSFSTQLTSPTNIYIRATDTDTVSSLRTISPLTTSVEGGTKVVSGRLLIENMYGPPASNLAAKVRALYWTGTQWALNTADALSGAATGNFALGATTSCPLGAPNYCGVSLLSAALLGAGGEFRLMLSPPTTGSDRRNVMLTSTLSYLPASGRETWGAYRSPYIYQRER